LGVVELAGQASFLQALRELALREVLGEPTLRVLLERWTIAHQRSVLRQGPAWRHIHAGTVAIAIILKRRRMNRLTNENQINNPK
jgi:hypothetical protein